MRHVFFWQSRQPAFRGPFLQGKGVVSHSQNTDRISQAATRRDERGFSLFELVVTLAIIGILVTVAIPAYRGVRVRAIVRDAQSAAVEWRGIVWACRVEKKNYETDCNTFSLIGFTGTSTNWTLSMTISGTGTGASAIFSAVAVPSSGDISGKTYTLTLTYDGVTTESIPTP